MWYNSILIVDDNNLVRRLLRSWLEQHSEWEICGEAENGQIAVERVEQLHPDIVILDLQMPGHERLEAARQSAGWHRHGDDHVYRI